MAKKRTTSKRAKAAATESLPGFEDKRIPELDTAISDYLVAKTRWQKAKEQSAGSLDAIADLLVKNILGRYAANGRQFSIEAGKAKVKITRVKKKAEAK